MYDAEMLRSRLAAHLQVSEARATEILAALEAVQADPMQTPSLRDGPEASDPHATLPTGPLSVESGGAEPTIGFTIPPDEPNRPSSGDARSVIATRYEDLGPLGLGGMGEVREVRDIRFDRILAMKVLRADRRLGLHSSGMFLREARIEARLQHPGIPPIYDHGELPDGRPWYTMKKVDGERLSDAIARLHEAADAPRAYTTLLRTVLRAFEAVCSTVAFAHTQGVVHRDLKPENIMIGAFGEVLVLDWGLAIEVAQNTTPPTYALQVVGTPHYMSPEQAIGSRRSLFPATDVYALGATLFHILTGRPPFHGGTSSELLQRHVHAHPPPRVPIEPDRDWLTPPILVRLCERAMAYDPDERLPEARIFADHIRDWLETAERKERALHELQQAEALQSASHNQHEQALSIWHDARAKMEADPSPSSDGWQQWERARQCFAEATRLERQSIAALEAALVHNEAQTEAHERLATHHSLTALEARERGAHDSARRTWTRVQRHLDALPSEISHPLRARIDWERSDPIHVERARRGSLIGRRDIRRHLMAQQNGGTRLMGIHGEPGVGKSALLVEHGHQLRRAGCRTFFANLQSVEGEHSLVQWVARAIGGDEALQSNVPSIPVLLGQDPAVLLLDNADHCEGPLRVLVETWLNACPELQVVCTSRAPLRSAAALPIHLPRMQRLSAMELLVRHARRADPDFDKQTLAPESLAAVVDELDGCPLAIELAAARLASFRLDELRARLGGRLDLLRSSGVRAGGLDAAMAVSWDCLTPEAQAVLAQSSVFRSGMDRTAAEDVLKVDGGRTAVLDALDELVRQNLLRSSRGVDDRTRYTLPRTVWTWAHARLREMTDGDSLFSELTERHATHFATLHHAHDVDTTTPVLRAAEVENFVVAAQRGPADAAVVCAQLASQVFITQGPVARSIELLESIHTRPDFAVHHRRTLLVLMGRCLRNAGRLKEARRRLMEAQDLENSSAKGASTGQPIPSIQLRATIDASLTRGLLEADEHHYAEAMTHYQSALEAARQAGDTMAQAKAHAGLSLLPPSEDEPDHTSHHLSTAVELARSAGDPTFAVSCIGNYGLALFRRSRIEEALACFADAEDGNRALQNHHAVATFSMNQGILLQRLGRPDASMDAFRRALEACKQGGDDRIRASVQSAMASLSLHRGHYDQAYRLANEALTWQESSGDQPMARRSRRLLAGICIDMGRLVTAARHLDALDAPNPEHLEPNEALFIAINRAIILMCSEGTESQARQMLALAVESARKTGTETHLPLALVNLAEAQAQVGDDEAAKASFEEALTLSRQTAPELAGICLGGLAVLAAQDGNVPRAHTLLKEADGLVQHWAIEHIRLQIRTGIVKVLGGDELGALHNLHQARGRLAELGLSTNGPIRHSLRFLEGKLRDRRSQLTSDIDQIPTAVRTDQQHLVALLSELAMLEQEACNFDASEVLLDRAGRICDALDDTQARANIVHQRLNLARERGNYDEARALGSQGLALSQQLADRMLEVRLRTNLGIIAQETGELREAEVHLTEAGRLADELDDIRGKALVTSNLAMLHFAWERYANAAEDLERAQQTFEEIGLERYAMLCEGNRGEALLRLNQLQTARELLASAARNARQHAHLHAEGAFLGALAETQARLGHMERAEALLTEAQSIGMDAPVEQAKLCCRASIVASLAADSRRAVAQYKEGVRIATELNVGPTSSVWSLVRTARSVLDRDLLPTSQ